MLFYRKANFAAMAVLLASATAVDITAELNSGWMMGLRPRQAAQNLQSFTGAVGGVGASAVCLLRCCPRHGWRSGKDYEGQLLTHV